MLSPGTREFIIGMKRITGDWAQTFHETIAYLAVAHMKMPHVFKYDRVKEEILTLHDLIGFIKNNH